MPQLYVGTIGEGLWRSADDGKTFSRLADGLFVECHVRALVAHPRDPRTLFLGTEMGLFKSGNGGDKWERVDSPLNGKQIWSILLLPDNPDVMFVGTCPAQLFRSEDGGKTWHEPQITLAQECPRIMWNRVTTLIPDPASKETIWCGVEIDGVHRSRDAGLTWTVLREGLSSQDIHSMAIVKERGRKSIFASTNNDVNLSTDEGQTWFPMSLGKTLPYRYFRGMTQKVDDPNVIFLGNGDSPPGTVGTVARSGDGGHTFKPAKLPNVANSTIWTFAVHAADPNLVYCNSVSGELYRSTDAGVSWTKLPIEFGEIRALLWTP